MSYSEDLHSAALSYHRLPRPGKLEILATKPLANQRDLALAYSPGVAAACTEIAGNPAGAASLTARANLVAVVSNGTAVLGLGNIGPLASKPVMEGKAVLFKKFAGIDVFDIEIDACEVQRAIDADRRMLFDIDVKGGLSLRRAFPGETLLVFIEPPSLAVLRARLEGRKSESTESIARRIDRAQLEMTIGNEYDVRVVNEDLDVAVDEVDRAIEAAG